MADVLWYNFICMLLIAVDFHVGVIDSFKKISNVPNNYVHSVFNIIYNV